MARTSQFFVDVAALSNFRDEGAYLGTRPLFGNGCHLTRLDCCARPCGFWVFPVCFTELFFKTAPNLRSGTRKQRARW